ncbi:hypothetical protein M8C21_019764 [Ambrosia artemisiifolia]|uniref:Laccase n=1 Tax=Ambrosia artemisiifolia TaxID=4212 RepID=A0AAD5CXP2_AMBAR|nr:hypothetical protein M8C21_019764 [Ambrosia artemisiifolia]
MERVFNNTQCAISLLSLLLIFSCFSSLANAKTHNHDFVVQATKVKRLCETHNSITVNGQFPGPTLEVNDGDTLVIHVTNKARYNVTIHWHGVRQLTTAWADGPEFITQCPIRPGGSYTYRFTISGQEGTLWWHAHSSWLRATVHGAIIIHPQEGYSYPFPKPHRESLIILGEWWDGNPIDVVREATRTGAAPNVSDAYTINGQPATKVKRLCETHNSITVNGQFPGPTLEVNNGDTLVIRVTNKARYNVTIHWHGVRQLTTAWADGPEFITQCPIRPGGSYTYRFTISGQEGTLWWHAHSSWLRATVYGSIIIHPQEGYSYPFPKPHRESLIILGEWWDANPIDVIREATRTGAAPNVSDAYTINGQPGDLYKCSSKGQTTDVLMKADQPTGRYYIAARAYASAQGAPFDNTTTTAILENCQAPNGTRFTASMNNVSFVLPSNISILQAHHQGIPGVFTPDFPANPPVTFDYTGNVSRSLWQPTRGTKVYKLKYGARVQIVLQGTNIFTAENHPIHLHGYDFYILAEGFGNFNPKTDNAKFNLVDPPLRNTVSLPVKGWAVIRFVADNPGTWIMHCHLDVHIGWGLATVFIVENGPEPMQKLEQPPPDLPVC